MAKDKGHISVLKLLSDSTAFGTVNQYWATYCYSTSKQRNTAMVPIFPHPESGDKLLFHQGLPHMESPRDPSCTHSSSKTIWDDLEKWWHDRGSATNVTLATCIFNLPQKQLVPLKACRDVTLPGRSTPVWRTAGSNTAHIRPKWCWLEGEYAPRN